MYDIKALLFELDPDLNKKEYTISDVYALKKIKGNKYLIGDEETPITIDTDHIKKISIITTDWGPFLCDVYLIICTASGVIYITEQEAPFFGVLYTAVSILDGFNYDVLIKSMQSIENGIFICYDEDD